jgi:hypothetical protein
MKPVFHLKRIIKFGRRGPRPKSTANGERDGKRKYITKIIKTSRKTEVNLLYYNQYVMVDQYPFADLNFLI